MIRRRYRFYGRVQGVGFRYRCMTIALRLGLTGFVKNEYDGSVSMEVQGDVSLVEQMIEQLYHEPFISIESIDVKDIVLKSNESDFNVKY